MELYDGVFCLMVVWMNKCWLFLTEGTDWELSSWYFNIYSLDGLMPKINYEIWVSCFTIILISTDSVKMINWIGVSIVLFIKISGYKLICFKGWKIRGLLYSIDIID